MSSHEKTVQFPVAFFGYVLAALAGIWVGFQVVEYAGTIKFYNRFLQAWETNVTRYTARDKVWPVFTGSNHAVYMDRLVRQMADMGLTLPGSNTRTPYIYRIARNWPNPDETIFILVLENQMVLFGLSKTTFDMLDKKIDNQLDLNNGQFKGRQDKTGPTFTGIWTQ